MVLDHFWNFLQEITNEIFGEMPIVFAEFRVPHRPSLYQSNNFLTSYTSF